jgi:hypothetical protein
MIRVVFLAVACVHCLSACAAVSLTPLTEPRPGARWEFRIDGVPSVTNPFDADAITVNVTFTTPSQTQVTVPAFWYQPYARSLANGTEKLTSSGNPEWRVRFTPAQAGSYLVRVNIQEQGQPYGDPASATFIVPNPGPNAASPSTRVQVVAGLPYFQTDLGQPLPLSGANVCWPGSRGTFDYDDWFGAMALGKENFARLWMAPWAFGIEAEPGTLTNYRLDRAWQLDYVLQRAEAKGIRVLLCLDFHGMFEVTPDAWGGNNFWPSNPYNVAQGGPCTNQNAFFTNPQAMHLYQKRLRYLVARYGYSPNLLGWEFFNEIDNVYRYLNSSDVAAWHSAMGQWLHAHDPFQHLVTTSFTGSSDRPEVWQLAAMDFTTYHSYNLPQPATGLAAIVRSFRERYAKPVLIEEYGVDWRGWGAASDPYLRGFRQGIWSGAFNGSVGTSMSWWWENIYAGQLYRTCQVLAEVTAGTDWGRGDWQPVTFQTSGDPPPLVGPLPRTGDPFTVQLALSSQWGERMRGQLAVPNPLAAMGAPAFLNSFVHGSAHADLRNPFQISAWFGTNAVLLLHLNSVSSGAILSVTIDGGEAFRQSVPNKDGSYQVNEEYNQDFPIALPPGNHLVEIRNPGLDWFYLDWVRLQNVQPADYVNHWTPSPASVGIQAHGEAFVYVINPAANYPANATNATVNLLTDGAVQIQDLPPGQYRAFWCDPSSGDTVAQTSAISDGALMTLSLPSFREDLAGHLTADFELGPLLRQPNGGVRLPMTGEPGQSISLETSTNLQAWQSLGSFVMTNGTMLWEDSRAGAEHQRFYRARQP